MIILRMKTKRLEEITKLLGIHGSMGVAQLSESLQVTEKTIRLDLATLEKMGIVERVHGGAIIKSSTNEIYPLPAKRHRNSKEKQAIAAAALSYINDGDIIILDSGSTTLELAKILDKKVIVITNDPFISYLLINNDKVTLLCTGGELRRSAGFAYTGVDVIRMISNYHVNKSFLATTAFDMEHGMTVFSSMEGEIKQAFLSASDQTYFLVDYSKFHQTALYSFAKTAEVDHIITDSRIPAKEVELLKASSIHTDVV